MCGCDSCEIVRASRSNRWRASGDDAMAGDSTLIGDVAIEPRVARPVDLAHAAGAERRDDFIWTETALPAASSVIEAHAVRLPFASQLQHRPSAAFRFAGLRHHGEKLRCRRARRRNPPTPLNVFAIVADSICRRPLRTARCRRAERRATASVRTGTDHQMPIAGYDRTARGRRGSTGDVAATGRYPDFLAGRGNGAT